MSNQKNNLHLKAVKMLNARYGMSVMVHTPNYDMVGLITECGNVGCEINDNAFEMGFSQPYGQFKYSKLHINHIGKASDIAFERCMRLSLASKKSDSDFSDELSLSGGTPCLYKNHNLLPDVGRFYESLCEHIKKFSEVVSAGGIQNTEAALSYLRSIPRFQVEKYPIESGDPLHEKAKLYKWQRNAIEQIEEELAYGLSLEEVKKPLGKMVECIEENKRIRTRTLFDEVNFNQKDREEETSISETEDDMFEMRLL